MALLNKKKSSKVKSLAASGNQAAKNYLASQSKPKTSGGYSAANPYTKPLSAQGQANVAAAVARASAPKSTVSSTARTPVTNPFTGLRSGYNPYAPSTGKLSKLEFAVVPSSQQTQGLGWADKFITNTAQTTPQVKQGYIPKAPTPSIMDQLTAPSTGGTIMQQLTGTGPNTPTVRNAVTTFKAPSSTTTTTTPTTEQRAAQSEAIAAMSEPMGASTVTSGGSQVSGAPSGTSGIRTGGASLVSEPTSSSQWAANLMRAQVEQGGGVSPVGDEVNLADLQKKRDETRAMLDQYGANAVSMPEFKANIAAMIAAGAENLKRIKPGPERPVIETPEQSDFIKGVDPFQQKDLMAWADDRRDQLGITDAQKERIDTLNMLQSVRETYQRVIDDIKANPNLPKGLAARRLTEVFEDQKFASAELLARLDALDQTIQDGNDTLDFELGIQKMEQDAQEKQYQRRMDQFGFMLESGALAGFNEEEIKNWALATGIPEASIRSMRDTAVDPSADYDITYKQDERTGDYYAFYINKKDPTDTRQVLIGNAGVKSSGGGGGNYTANTMPLDLKNEVISVLNSQAVADKLGRAITLSDLITEFPNVDVDALSELYEAYKLDLKAPAQAEKKNLLTKAVDWWESLNIF